jgi:hypothetical protein
MTYPYFFDRMRIEPAAPLSSQSPFAAEDAGLQSSSGMKTKMTWTFTESQPD